MSETIYVTCTCGREYNAGALSKCPLCGTPSRAATPASVTPTTNAASTPPSISPGRGNSVSSDFERRMLSEAQEQTRQLRAIRWMLFGFALWFIVLPVVFFSLATR